MMKYRVKKQPERDIWEEFPAVRKLILLLTGTIFVLVSGCSKDDPAHTEHPDKGAVAVTVDWSKCSSDAVVPESYILRIGGKEQTVSGETNVFQALFLPGRQNLLVFHQLEGITVGGITATMNTLPDGTLERMSGDLFSGTADLDIVKDDTLRVTVSMRQHTRRLTLTLKLTPGDELRIAETSAILTGIASTVDLTTGTVTSAGNKTVIPVFTVGTDNIGRAEGQPVLATTLYLLGVAAKEKQVLTLVVTLTDGHVQTLATDLTEALKNFDTGTGMEPLMLDASLILPVETGMSGTITDWLPGNKEGEDIDIK